ncbi:hypothetical protein MKEN_00145900 [Mycena kentingensis (nom. inval.)]|nr:hypothetical protein MKEN_00145900 [Mycena kentingensis (nom. inval.)]
MYALPVELHSIILDFAPSQSIPALCGTSRYFNAVAAPYRFHQLSISSKNAQRLLPSFRVLPEHHRRVYSLSITLPDAPSLPAVLGLLQLAKETISTLVVVSPAETPLATEPVSFGAILRVAATFPQLEELTLHGRHPPLPLPAGGWPRLRRLDLSGNPRPTGLPLPLASFLTLEQLRVSGLHQAVGFARALQDAVSQPGLIGRLELVIVLPPRKALPSRASVQREAEMRGILASLATSESDNAQSPIGLSVAEVQS